MKKAASTSAIILIIVLIFAALPGMSYATGSANYEKAVDLKILGLLSGSASGFDLGRAPNRVEGAVMLVRLLGKESQALQAGYTHPFKDVPAWGDCYVGYMYQNNLTAGVGDGNFGSDEPLSALQYVVFVIRALGYDDKKNDFKYPEALDKAVKIGLLTADAASSLKSKNSFLRDDMVGISYNALNVKLKASGRTLLDKLVLDDKAIYKPAATVLGLYTSELKSEIGNIDKYSPASTKYGYIAKNSNDLFLITRKFLYRNQNQFKVDISSYKGDAFEDFKAVFDRAFKAVEKNTGVDNFYSSWECHQYGSVLTITFTYTYTKEGFDSRRDKVIKTVNKARQVVSGLIGKKMSDYDKEKLLHDYIVNNTRYDIKNFNAGIFPEDAFTAYGCLIRGVTMCQGYSYAMKLLCDLSGVECLVVNGESLDEGKWSSHAWNQVRVDDAWYHLDVTFDDPVIDDGEDMLTYHYFNLADADIVKAYRWEKGDYPACNSVENGYYYKNKMIAGNREEFVNAVKAAVEQHKTQIELRISDYTEDKYSDLSDIVFASDTVSRFRYLVNEEFGIVLIYEIQYF